MTEKLARVVRRDEVARRWDENVLAHPHGYDLASFRLLY